MPASFLYLAAAAQPLFGNPWLALGAVLAGVAVLMLVVFGAGRWLAATHPEERRTDAPTILSEVPSGIPPQVLAAIAAAIEVAEGPGTRIAAVARATPAAPTVEMLMQQWSIEGRRQIYSSHQLR